MLTADRDLLASWDLDDCTRGSNYGERFRNIESFGEEKSAAAFGKSYGVLLLITLGLKPLSHLGG